MLVGRIGSAEASPRRVVRGISAVSGVKEERVVRAFGPHHGFRVVEGVVAWAEMAERLEAMRRDALSAGV